eukprot:8976296-Lingulodinium_polyedra.AAC.1
MPHPAPGPHSWSPWQRAQGQRQRPQRRQPRVHHDCYYERARPGGPPAEPTSTVLPVSKGAFGVRGR